VALALLAVCAIGISGLTIGLKLALLLLAGLLLARALRALLRPWPLLEWDAAGQWWLHGGGRGLAVAGSTVAELDRDMAIQPDPAPAVLLGAARLGPLLVLRLRIEGKRRALLLTPGMLPAVDLRRLRVRLGLG
jgi:hypothetical protein